MNSQEKLAEAGFAIALNQPLGTPTRGRTARITQESPN
jgi:hypothetical protein